MPRRGLGRRNTVSVRAAERLLYLDDGGSANVHVWGTYDDARIDAPDGPARAELASFPGPRVLVPQFDADKRGG